VLLVDARASVPVERGGYFLFYQFRGNRSFNYPIVGGKDDAHESRISGSLGAAARRTHKPESYARAARLLSLLAMPAAVLSASAQTAARGASALS
jgi:hypothetical protein